MSECETVRGLRFEVKKEISHRNDAYRERDAYQEYSHSLKCELDTVKKQRDDAIRERDALREEIARRDAEKPTTALSWIEKMDARLDKIEQSIEDINRRRVNGVAWVEKTLLRLEKIEARQDGTGAWKSGCADGYNDLEKRLDSLTTSIYNRLDGPTGVEKRIVAVEARLEKMESRQDGTDAWKSGCADGWKDHDRQLIRIGVNLTAIKDRLAKLEARVSKKRVKK